MIEAKGLFCAPLQDSRIYDKLYQGLSDYRKDKVNRAKTDSGKIQRVASGYLLEEMLASRGVASPYEYEVSEVGKPYLKDKTGNLSFSLSHTNGLVVCGVSESDIGIDVEPIQRYNRAIAHRFFVPEEWEWIESGSEEEWGIRFYKIWTYKEAADKMLGEALPKVIKEIVYPEAMGSGQQPQWHWKNWIVDNYVVTLCSASAIDIDRILMIDIEEECARIKSDA